MVDEKQNVSRLSRRRFLVSATAMAGLVTTASGAALLGASSSVGTAQAAADSSVSVSVSFGDFAAYSFQSDVANKKISIKMTYSPTDPQDAGQANAKAVVLNVFAPGVSAAAGKPSGVAGGPAGNQHLQISSSAQGEYVLVVHNWDSMKRTVSVTLSAAYVGGAALPLKGVSGAAVTAQAPAQASPATATKVSWPLPYEKVDVETARLLGHKGYYEASCAYGAFNAVLEQLQNKVGGPFLGIPAMMARFGEGGIVGWGTICGALNGAASAVNLVCSKDDYTKIINELMGWYTTTEFPTDISNQYAEEGKFIVEKMKYDKALPQNVVASPLCHPSVTEWCKVAQVSVNDPKRSERCGRLTGDVAAQTVLLLNQHADKEFVGTFKLSTAVTGCTSCHNSKADFAQGGIVNTKMDCAPCHGENPHNKQ